MIRKLSAVLLAALLAGCANVAELDPYESSSALNAASREIAIQAEREGDYGLAATMLRRLRFQPHAPATIAREEARMLALAGRLDEAGEVLFAYLERNPSDAIGRRQAANLKLAMDKPQDALALIEKTTPPVADPLWHNTGGAVLDRLGRHDEARTAYRTGLAAAPGDVTLTTNLGLSFLLSGDRGEALTATSQLPLDQVLAAGQGWNLALIKASAGQTDSARSILVAMGRGPTVTNDLAQLNALRALPPTELRRALAPRTNTATP